LGGGAGPRRIRSTTTFDPQPNQKSRVSPASTGVSKVELRTRRHTPRRPFVIKRSHPLAAPQFIQLLSEVTESDPEEPYEITVRIPGQEVALQKTRTSSPTGGPRSGSIRTRRPCSLPICTESGSERPGAQVRGPQLKVQLSQQESDDAPAILRAKGFQRAQQRRPAQFQSQSNASMPTRPESVHSKEQPPRTHIEVRCHAAHASFHCLN